MRRSWSILFDPATGERVLASAFARARAGVLGWLRWLLEVAGVLAIAVASWMVAPALGLVVVGFYLILLASVGDTDEK